jgi:hypothetical protein
MVAIAPFPPADGAAGTLTNPVKRIAVTNAPNSFFITVKPPTASLRAEGCGSDESGRQFAGLASLFENSLKRETNNRSDSKRELVQGRRLTGNP